MKTLKEEALILAEVLGITDDRLIEKIIRALESQYSQGKVEGFVDHLHSTGVI